MKALFRTFLVTLLVLGLAAVVGCTGNVKAPTPRQIATTVCPVFQADLVVLQGVFAADTTNANAAKISADIGRAQPAIASFCANLATVSTTSLEAFAQTALPALADAVTYLPLTAAQKTKIVNDLTLAETALGLVGVVESIVQPPAAPVVAATVAAH